MLKFKEDKIIKIKKIFYYFIEIIGFIFMTILFAFYIWLSIHIKITDECSMGMIIFEGIIYIFMIFILIEEYRHNIFEERKNLNFDYIFGYFFFSNFLLFAFDAILIVGKCEFII